MVAHTPFLAPQGQPCNSQEITDVSYVDDDTYFVMGTPQELIPKVQALTENVHAGFSSRGLNMNFGDFKCAAVATCRGVGSKKAPV